MFKKISNYLTILAVTIGTTTLTTTYAQTNPARNTIFVGIVRNNTGYLYRFSGSHEATNAGKASWDTCPEQTVLLGRNFQPNGFWLCASSDIANRGTFYFGNVVNNTGYYWEVAGSQAKSAGNVKWDTCWQGQLRGRLFTPNGFWVCQP